MKKQVGENKTNYKLIYYNLLLLNYFIIYYKINYKNQKLKKIKCEQKKNLIKI